MSPISTMAPSEGDATTESLELRVRRLEDAVASLQDTRLIEERILERLQRQQRKDGAAAAAASTEAEVHIISGDRLSLSSDPTPEAIPAQPSEPTPGAMALLPAPNVVKEAWLVVEIFRDLSAMFRMFFDIRYRVGWFARIFTFVMVPLLLLSSWWNPLAWVPFVGSVLNNALIVLLSFLLFKILSREARRYQRTRTPDS